MVLYFLEFTVCPWHVLVQKCRMCSFLLCSDALGHLSTQVALLVSCPFHKRQLQLLAIASLHTRPSQVQWD